jgi:ribosomal protein S1
MSEVPAEVEAMDGVDSEEEMHNSERPARASGTAKHHKKEEKGKPISELEVGSSVSAIVKTTTSYGAFLDIGCSTDALLHISRLSDDFVSNVEDIVKAGDEVTVRIVSVDTEKNQVAVTMQSKEKEDENASRVAEKRSNAGRRKERPQRSGADRESQRATLSKLSEGGFDDTAFVEGEVVSVLDFGAFVRFDTTPLGSEGEVDGLVHISAISEGRANSVSEFVSVGDKVQVRVRTVDVDGGKVSLSMITKEAEEANPGPREKKSGGRRGREMFSPSDMGAANWAETMAEFDSTQPAFTNRPIVEDKRKK